MLTLRRSFTSLHCDTAAELYGEIASFFNLEALS